MKNPAYLGLVMNSMDFLDIPMSSLVFSCSYPLQMALLNLCCYPGDFTSFRQCPRRGMRSSPQTLQVGIAYAYECSSSAYPSEPICSICLLFVCVCCPLLAKRLLLKTFGRVFVVYCVFSPARLGSPRNGCIPRLTHQGIGHSHML